MLTRILTAAMCVAITGVTALADMTYSPTLMSNAMDASGNLIADGTYVMVLDLDNDGWQGTAYDAQSAGLDNAGAWLWDADDMLMDRGQIIDGEAYPFKILETAGIPAAFTPGVDHYYVLWFDTPYNAGAAGPGVGVAYGAEDLGVVGTDPGDYTPDGLGGNAILTTVAGVVASWHNDAMPGDVDNDGDVDADDAAILIAKINAEGPRALQQPGDDLPPPDGVGLFWDVTGDAAPFLSPLDALRVINEINGVGGLELQALSVAEVPEPASMLLLTAGAGLLLRRRALRRN